LAANAVLLGRRWQKPVRDDSPGDQPCDTPRLPSIFTSVSEDPYTAPSQFPVPPPLPPPPSSGGIGDNAGIRLLIPVGRSGWAIAAGYLGLFSFVLIPAPISLIVSFIAIRDIRRSTGTAKVKHGMGRAIFGLVMGILGTLALAAILITSLLSK
jgi:hypothetical protein